MKENETNLYTKQFEYGNKLKNLGFDYHEEDILLKKTMMPRLFLNENVKGFLSYVNNVMVNNIDAVKILQNFINYTVKKNDMNTK
tara:strand:+ start:127 stop:381 length:255 start_codon:yes stop_codon:yes gene_type:complete